MIKHSCNVKHKRVQVSLNIAVLSHIYKVKSFSCKTFFHFTSLLKDSHGYHMNFTSMTF